MQQHLISRGRYESRKTPINGKWAVAVKLYIICILSTDIQIIMKGVNVRQH